MLDERGANVTAGGARGLRVESKLPHFICLSSGDGSSAVTLYTFKEGITRIGNPSTDDEEMPPQDVDLHGDGAEPEHAIVEFEISLNEELQQLQEVGRRPDPGLLTYLTCNVLLENRAAPHC